MEFTIERFLENLKGYSVEVISSNAETRHLKIRSSECTNFDFDIVTYDHYLIITGRMGSNVFSRTKDMFNFFSQKLEDGINPCYWGGNLRTGGDGKEFSEDAVRESIQGRVEHVCKNIQSHFERFEDHEGKYKTVESFEKAFRKEVKLHFNIYEICQRRYVSVIEEFESNLIQSEHGVFGEEWEWMRDQKYTYSYLWQCHAIVWAIEKFRELEESALPDQEAVI